jgi:hypothetical protein
MPGRNLFESVGSLRLSTLKRRLCVFISYRRADRVEARQLADALLKANVDIYFDEDDECLDGADEESNPKKVLRCIDAGLNRSTDLLGLITARTRGSWWVPYEIGVTRAQSVACAFLIHRDVKELPAYVRASTILADRKELRSWLPSIKRAARASTSAILLEALERLALDESPAFIPKNRSPLDISFY